MKAAAFAYERPSDLNAALFLMAKATGMTKIIAGGQSLGPMLNLRLVEPDLIVDISGLSELKQAERSGDELVIGACITHGDIEDGRIADVTRGAMQRVAGAIAYRAVRNRGTIGGALGALGLRQGLPQAGRICPRGCSRADRSRRGNGTRGHRRHRDGSDRAM